MSYIPNKTAVYAIVNKLNGYCYIGSTVNIQRRWHHHKYTLVRGISHHTKLQRAWTLYGRNCFKFIILEICEKEVLLEREQVWLNREPQYNSLLDVKGGSMRGKKQSDYAKEVASRTHKGKTISEEHKQRIREFGRSRPGVNRGRKWSDEYKQKMSEIGKRAWARRRGEL